MKKLIATSVICLTTLAAVETASADTTELKQSAVFGSAAVLGGIAGGPVGFIAGALAGAFIGEEIKQADESVVVIETKNQKLANLEEELAVNQAILIEQKQSAKSLASLLQNLPSQVYFATNSDQLTPDGEAIVEVMAELIKQDPTMHVELVGHTDPRGTDEFNNVLSQYRAEAVREKLMAYGISGNKITSKGEGSNKSTAIKGDKESYALERRVDIELITPRGLAFQNSF